MALSLAQAQEIARATLQKARALDLNPLAVAVLDVSGEVKCLYREDEAAPLRCGLAVGKAWGALSWGAPSRQLGDIAVERPAFFTALSAMGSGKIVPAAGGVLLHTKDGLLAGAAGVSGDLSDKDERCAIAGAEAAGLYWLER